MQDHDGLHQAAATGDFLTVYHAIHRDPSRINQPDPLSGHTPLQAAQIGRHGHIVKLLISAGARVHRLTPGCMPGEVSLYAAAEEGNPELLAAALATSEADLDTPDPLSGLTPLMFAIRGRHFNAVEMLLRSGADPEQPDDDGNKPLFGALNWRSADMVRLLLGNGADAVHADSSGRTPLMRAATLFLDEDIVLLLKQHGA